jgi:peptidylamidoglycolate lyase
MKKTLLLLLLIPFVFCCDESTKSIGEYELTENWAKIPDSYVFGNPTGIALNSNQNLVVFHRGPRSWQMPMPKEKITEDTFVEIDKVSGEIIKSWGSNLFIMPHGLEIDKKDNIWITDVGLHQVIKYDSNGNELMVLGEENTPGNDPLHFNLPTDVAVSDNGSFYVSDGYGNSRIIKFSSEGEYLLEWGVFGENKNEFNIPHGLDLDNYGNVYVADRENNKIQKFDSLGNFIAEWKNEMTGQLYSVNVNNDYNYLLGIDYIGFENLAPVGSDIIKFDLDLNLKLKFGRSRNYKGPKARYHDIQVDNKGNIYVGDILNNTIQKFKPIKILD